jgi:hypothetical protein
MQLSELSRAFAFALHASDNEAFGAEARAVFRRIADAIWRAAGDGDQVNGAVTDGDK